MIERDLFGTVRLVRNWGRIGTNGQELVQEFATESEAGEALAGMTCKFERGRIVAGSPPAPLSWRVLLPKYAGTLPLLKSKHAKR
jgi:hypothetical protein